MSGADGVGRTPALSKLMLCAFMPDEKTLDVVGWVYTINHDPNRDPENDEPVLAVRRWAPWMSDAQTR